VAALAAHRAELEGKQETARLTDEVEKRTRDLEFRTQRLLAEKEMMHGIISNANFGLIAVDTANFVHLMNPYALSLIGRGADNYQTMIGTLLEDVMPPEVKGHFLKLFEQVITGDEDRRGTSTQAITIKDKRLDVIAYPITYRQQISAVVFIIHDVSDKELLQQRLMQTAKLASIGELAAGVAHEINNPIGFVTSNCNTLTDYMVSLEKYISGIEGLMQTGSNGGAPSALSPACAELRTSLDVGYILEDVKSLLAETQDGLGRVSKIVRDLKTFARVDSDIPQTSQMNTLIDDALNLVRNETKYKLEIVRNFGAIPEIPCLPNQLVQVFTNLFINASHATKEKGTLTITTETADAEVRIKVRDTGGGIPEHILPRIFDPFFTTKEPGKGTGMGLSISFGIVERHGGTITVASRVGVGTEFTVSLPTCGIVQEIEEAEAVKTT
jgi:signal transduction histidine kinase